MQIWKSVNIFVFIWKKYVEDFTLKHLLLFEICAPEVCEKFIYKHSETIEYAKNYPAFFEKITWEVLGLRMRNFQGFDFLSTQTKGIF